MPTNLRISGAQSFPISESDIRMNYRDTSRIIAAANSISPTSLQAQFFSSDGGAHWGQTNLSLASGSGDVFQSDPAVDWTSDGTAWAITIGFQRDAINFPENMHLRCYKSTDGGQTWAFDSTVSGTQTNADKEMMWVDHSDSSIFKDNMYVIWHNGSPAFVATRTGIGGPWSAPRQVSGIETMGTAIGGDIKTNGVGDVFAFWPDTGSRKLLVAKSTNGGATFGAPVTIATTFGSFEIAVPADDERKALIYISGGAFRAGTKDLVYAVWPDLSGAPGCTSGEGPGADASSPCKSRIWFSRSTDGGTTWETVRMINNQPSLNDQFHPRLVVDETNGELVVVYYDTREDPQRHKSDVWAQTSCDDGVTWNFARRVTTAETDETVSGADNGQFGNQYGDYIGLSGFAGRFVPCWTDRRNGGREEIWSASIPTDPVNPDDPFNFGGFWLATNGQGGEDNGDDVSLGRNNTDSDNGQCTMVNTTCFKTATLAGDNHQSDNAGGVGVFGRSRTTDWSIGVLGQSSKGCAVYGLATDENPTTSPPQRSHGIGVVGRSLGGLAPEKESVETMMGDPIGVLGHSANGPGVRGHGGPLPAVSLQAPLCPVQAAPGGVFSSGQLGHEQIPEATAPQPFSGDALPQVRLIPSKRPILPTSAQIGDFFLVYLVDPPGAQLWVCTDIVGNVPQWQRVQMDPTRFPGGAAV